MPYILLGPGQEPGDPPIFQGTARRPAYPRTTDAA